MTLSATELPDFNHLRKAARAFIPREDLKLAALCDSAPQFLVDALKGSLALNSINAAVWEGDIGQVDQQMQAPGSDLW